MKDKHAREAGEQVAEAESVRFRKDAGQVGSVKGG